MIGKKIGSALVVTALVLATAVPAASAHRSQDDKDKAPRVEMLSVDLFYGDFDSNIHLFAGLTAEDFCNGVTPQMAKARVSERGDGTLTLKTSKIRRVDLYLYWFDGGGGPELIDATCAAMFDDDPTTQPLQPFASGKGRVRITHSGLDSVDDTGGFHIRNSARGTVTSADGSRWKVRGRANFDLADEGFPIGDPADFQGLRIRKLRHGW